MAEERYHGMLSEERVESILALVQVIVEQVNELESSRQRWRCEGAACNLARGIKRYLESESGHEIHPDLRFDVEHADVLVETMERLNSEHHGEARRRVDRILGLRLRLLDLLIDQGVHDPTALWLEALRPLQYLRDSV